MTYTTAPGSQSITDYGVLEGLGAPPVAMTGVSLTVLALGLIPWVFTGT